MWNVKPLLLLVFGAKVLLSPFVVVPFYFLLLKETTTKAIVIMCVTNLIKRGLMVNIYII